MKKGFLIFVMATAAFLLRGQLPEVSTDSKPIWYYIQVVGDGSDRANRVWTVEGTDVYGRPMETQTNVDKQLFRFEMSGNNFVIINKSTEKIVDVIKDSDARLTVSSGGTSFIIAQIPNTNYYNLETTRIPTGGSSGEKWAHQGNSGYSYHIILTGTSYYRGENSKYSFVAYDEVNLTYSDSSTEAWYCITSANPAYQNKCVTDVTASTASLANYTITDIDASNSAQQWKLVKRTDDKVDFVNKATGNIMSTTSTAGEFYNYTQFTKNDSETNGWTLAYNNGAQYVISGVEEDGNTRYWRMTLDNQVPDKYDTGNILYSDFAWRIKKANGSGTDLKQVESDGEFTVYTENRRIVVEGTEDYTVRTIQGLQVNKTEELPVGIYLVSIGKKTIKVLVK
ncbi:hypothetical protein D0T49_10105 [Paludibacter sp. 221]|uniref:RICIN domain-containing protein n=1 Tax=Paludibacter sp. 221 TaxID=2302939 RepID=UPI0013D82F13|nr:RICIN domain-containing protein [Paludibacter sp. 221]NDV47398.1 hypothetical protein [Paludibacter sp. 221]